MDNITAKSIHLRSKRQREHGELTCDGSCSKRSRLIGPPKRKHLYLALDDCRNGFSIHKIDLDGLEDTAGADLPEPIVGFPDPAVLRLAAPAPQCQMNFMALGSTIFIATNPHCGQTPTLVYDTDTALLSIGPRLPPSLLPGLDIAVAAGDTLYGLSSVHSAASEQHPFEALTWQAAPDMGGELMKQQPSLSSPPRPSMDEWSWKSVPSRPPFGKSVRITSYAVHPDGRTIFVTVRRDDDPERRARGTYGFDAERCQWRWLGRWALPFCGQGQYDDELGAWVGLRDDGYVCSCQVASPNVVRNAAPDWNVGREKLFGRVSESRRVPAGGPRATLAYMGDGMFCLVECVVRHGVVESEPEGAFLGDRGGFMLHISTFGLKYSHKGELQIKSHDTVSRVVSKHILSFEPAVFWI